MKGQTRLKFKPQSKARKHRRKNNESAKWGVENTGIQNRSCMINVLNQNSIFELEKHGASENGIFQGLFSNLLNV